MDTLLHSEYARWLLGMVPQSNATGTYDQERYQWLYERMLRGVGRHDEATDEFIASNLKAILRREHGDGVERLVDRFVSDYLNGPKLTAVQ